MNDRGSIVRARALSGQGQALPLQFSGQGQALSRQLRRAVSLFCLALVSLVFLVAPARAQSGRMRPEPQPSPSPGAQQQRPRRATRGTEDAPPGEPSSPAAPSRTGSLPQSGAPPKQNANSKPTPDAPEAIDEDEVLNVESNLVPVSASVTDALGHPITDLKLEDFELRVDGQPKPISDISHAETPVRLALLFDNSSSIRPTRELEKQAAINFFRRVIRPAADQASIFSISTVPTLDQPLTNDVSRLVRTIEHYGEVEGSTSLFDTIVMAADYLRSQPGRKVMIIVSDGVETTSNLEDYGEMVRRVLASDCQVFVIQTGLSSNANLRDLTAERRMQDLTSYTGGFVYVPKVPSDLEAAFAQIAADLAQQYVLSYYPNDDARDGRFRAISVRIKTRGDVRVRARRGYYPRRRANLSAAAPGPTASELAASAPDFIRDPAAQISQPRQANAPARTNAPAQSATNQNAPGQSADASARINVAKASAPRRGSKNLDPDADDDAADATAKPQSSLRPGTFVPQTTAQTAQGPDDSPPARRSEPPPGANANRPSPDAATAAQPNGPPAQPPPPRNAPTQDSTPPVTTQPNPSPQTPSTQTSSAQTSAAQNPNSQIPSPQTPSPQTNAAQAPATETTPASQQSPPAQQPAQSAQQSRQSQQSKSEPSKPEQSQARAAASSQREGAQAEAAKGPVVVSGGVLNSRARSLPVPAYPEMAKRMRVGGTVVVEVTIDEGGKVVEARAAMGPEMLRESAVAAARRATFPPATVGGQPARMKGVINYTFTF